MKKFLALYYVVIYPILAFLIIYYLRKYFLNSFVVIYKTLSTNSRILSSYFLSVKSNKVIFSFPTFSYS